MKHIFTLTMLLIAILLILTGCGNGSSSVLQPVHPVLNADQPILVGVTEFDEGGNPASGVGALGIFSLRLDKGELIADLSPLRNVALTDVLEIVDITNFLQMAPCTDCVKIKSVSLNMDGNLVVSMGIKHPFDAGDPLKPPTGKNRADLHVFNVEGTIISNATGVVYPGIEQSTAGFTLVNADGYSAYLDTVLDDIYPTDATIHPYIIHFEDYSTGNYDPLNPTGFENVTVPGPVGYLVMPMGSDYDYKDYVFDVEDSMNLIFAVGCTYAVSSASKSQRFLPEYRCPQHNKKAASEVGIEIVTNDLKGEDILSEAQIEVRVVDINHAVAVGDALDEMLSDSSVGNITIDIPGVMSDVLIIDGTSPVSGSGHDPSDPLVYSGIIVNTDGAPEGTYYGAVKVLDSYSPGLNSSPLLNGADGIQRVDPLLNPLTGTFEINQFFTCQTFTIDVATAYVPQLTLVYENTYDPDLPQNTFGMDMDEADERGPCLNWESDGEYCINMALQFAPFDEPWSGHRELKTFFTNDLQTIDEAVNSWSGGVGWRNWNKTYMSARIDATYASFHEIDGLQHPLGIMDHSVQTSWAGGEAYMDHCSEIFVSRTSGQCFIMGDHSGTIRYGISDASDDLPSDFYNHCYTSTITSGYISECHSMEDDSLGNIYLAFFDGAAMAEIRLARSTDIGVGHSWDIDPLYTGGSQATEVRDPGIDVDDDDNIHISFSRKLTASGEYELIYVRSDDGGESFTSPLVVSTSLQPIHDTPVRRFTDPLFTGYEFVIVVYETGDQVYLNWSGDGGITWQEDPVQVSETGVINHDPDFEIDTLENHIHVIFVADDPVTFGDTKIANYYFEII